MAFQIIDDLLDYVGDVSMVGKPIGGDLRQGLITLPMLNYVDSHPDDPAVINLLNHKCIIDEDEIQRVINAIKDTDAIEKTSNQAKKFAEEAQQSLSAFVDSEAKQSLLTLTEYTIDRVQ
jgi:geranylgeranyl pyrophosphate synthase